LGVPVKEDVNIVSSPHFGLWRFCTELRAAKGAVL